MNDDGLKEQIETLLSSILSIPGEKILTLFTAEQETFVVDIDKSGVIGHVETHESLFREQLAGVFKAQGGLLIRQVLPMTVERELPGGETILVPEKNIYGIRIEAGRWEPLSKEDVKEAHCTDSSTGELMIPGKDISFVDFPIDQHIK